MSVIVLPNSTVIGSAVNLVVETPVLRKIIAYDGLYTVTKAGLFQGVDLVSFLSIEVSAAIDARTELLDADISALENQTTTEIERLDEGISSSLAYVDAEHQKAIEYTDTQKISLDNTMAAVQNTIATLITTDAAFAQIHDAIVSEVGETGLIRAMSETLISTYASLNDARVNSLESLSVVFDQQQANYSEQLDLSVDVEGNIHALRLESLETSSDGNSASISAVEEITLRYENDGGLITLGFLDGSITIFTTIQAPLNANTYDLWRIHLSQIEIGENGPLIPESSYVSDDGYIYKYLNSDNIWIFATSTQVSFILNVTKVISAEALADDKVRIFNNTPNAPYDIGDLWINNGEIYDATISRKEGFLSSEWKISTKYSEDILSVSTALNTRIDTLSEGLQDAVVEGVSVAAYTLDKNNLNSKIDEEITARTLAVFTETSQRVDDITARIQKEALLDGRIDDSEQALIDESLSLSAAYENYTNTVKQALVDGEISDAESAAITTAQAALELESGEIRSDLKTAYENYTNTVKQALIDGEIDNAEASAIATAKEALDLELSNLEEERLSSGMISLGLSDGSITFYTSELVPEDAKNYDVWKAPLSALTLEESSALSSKVAYGSDSGFFYMYYLEGIWKPSSAEQVSLLTSVINLASVEALADNKVRLFNTTPFGPYDSDDLWFKDGEIYHALKGRETGFLDNEWKISTRYTEDILNISSVLTTNLQNYTDTVKQALVDGEINDAELNAIAAAQEAISEESLSLSSELTTAYENYTATVKQSLIDGEISGAEESAISTAQTALENAINTVNNTIDNEKISIRAKAGKFAQINSGGTELLTGWQSVAAYEEGEASTDFAIFAENFKIVTGYSNVTRDTDGKITEVDTSEVVSPFSIDGDEIYFNGRVNFSNVINSPSAIKYADSYLDPRVIGQIGDRSLVAYNTYISNPNVNFIFQNTGLNKSDKKIDIYIGETFQETFTLKGMENGGTFIQIYSSVLEVGQLKLIAHGLENTFDNVISIKSVGVFDLGADSLNMSTLIKPEAGSTWNKPFVHSLVWTANGWSINIGSTSIDGALITTGKISSHDTETYFDLDNNAIKLKSPDNNFVLDSSSEGTYLDPNIEGAYIKGAVILGADYFVDAGEENSASLIFVKSTSKNINIPADNVGRGYITPSILLYSPTYGNGFLDNRVSDIANSILQVTAIGGVNIQGGTNDIAFGYSADGGDWVKLDTLLDSYSSTKIYTGPCPYFINTLELMVESVGRSAYTNINVSIGLQVTLYNK